MQIVNFIKDSFQDCLPFNHALTLFSFGCNLKCKMCEGYNYETITNKDNIIGNAKEIIEENITPLHDCVVFLGGEPTIYDDELIEVLKYCKSINLKTKIFTNGILSNIIEKINNLKLCDAWSVDFKGISNINKEFGVCEYKYNSNWCNTILNIERNYLPLEIRTTFYDGNIEDEDKIKKFGYSIINQYKALVYKKYIIQNDNRRLLNDTN